MSGRIRPQVKYSNRFLYLFSKAKSGNQAFIATLLFPMLVLPISLWSRIHQTLDCSPNAGGFRKAVQGR